MPLLATCPAASPRASSCGAGPRGRRSAGCVARLPPRRAALSRSPSSTPTYTRRDLPVLALVRRVLVAHLLAREAVDEHDRPPRPRPPPPRGRRCAQVGEVVALVVLADRLGQRQVGVVRPPLERRERGLRDARVAASRTTILPAALSAVIAVPVGIVTSSPLTPPAGVVFEYGTGPASGIGSPAGLHRLAAREPRVELVGDLAHRQRRGYPPGGVRPRRRRPDGWRSPVGRSPRSAISWFSSRRRSAAGELRRRRPAAGSPGPAAAAGRPSCPRAPPAGLCVSQPARPRPGTRPARRTQGFS